MNLPEKFRNKERSTASVSNERRAMEEALARLNQAQAPEHRACAERQIPPAPDPNEFIQVKHFCAQYDQLYITVYRRGANGLYSFWTSVAIDPRAGPAFGEVGDIVTVTPDMLDPNGPPEWCAWCETPEKMIYGKRILSIKCGACGCFICLGRLEGNYFRCRDSCGCSGEVSRRSVNAEGERRKAANPQPSVTTQFCPAEAPAQTGMSMVLRRQK